MAGNVFSVDFNLYMSALGFRNDVIGLFNSLPAVAVLFVGLPFAALADRIGYRWIILGGSVAATLASLALALAGARLPAVLAAGAFALALTVIGILAVPMLTQLSSPGERVALFAVGQSLSWVGTLVGNLLGGLAPEAASRLTHAPASSAGSLRAAFLAMTILLLGTLPAAVRLSGARGLVPTEAFPLRQLLQVNAARFTRILLPQLSIGIGAGMLLNFVQLFLAQRFGLGPGPIGAVLAAIAALAAATSLLSPLVSRRLGMTRAIALSQLCGFPLVLGLAFAFSLPLALAILALRQLALNVQGPLVQVFGMEYVDARERARLAVSQTVVFSVGFGGLGPLLSGLLQVRGGYQLAFTVSAFFYLVGGSTFLALFGRTRLASEG
jgi:MFS family permease